ncbi:LytTR family DNA-binding domain-containing protein [Pelomonas sp. SE-A7]|uniref:LytR/AlgR family response regulator transcription factor n=1 Tax=Pelomonas sp. SE-A7 TaxID=3054953 RepID=UPI00259D10A1|nr:LytTR family DNA-binding domain-containing protein [Pelomonas sp. SE-A7]MDM4764618.1 LytTR family DNA-binding domain-containing protein [Pelomonas sp. SE-A7]
MSRLPTALIADDEPLLRDSLERSLARHWPELQVLAQARNGREAVELFEQFRPDVVFLDVHMPGLNGVEAARQIGRRAQLVFVTAYEQYAVQAFEQGALDYLVKPFEEQRLADTIGRLRERLADTPAAGAPLSASVLEAAIEQLADVLRRPAASASSSSGEGHLQWVRASVGQTLKLIPVDQIDFLRSDEKYTLVVWAEGEALIRMSIRELIEQLDPKYFAQVHRSVVVNLRSVSHLTRGPNETADIHLRGRSEVLPVSRSYLHLFRQM